MRLDVPNILTLGDSEKANVTEKERKKNCAFQSKADLRLNHNFNFGLGKLFMY